MVPFIAEVVPAQSPHAQPGKQIHLNDIGIAKPGTVFDVNQQFRSQPFARKGSDSWMTFAAGSK